MTFDELDHEVNLIRKKGLTPFVEHNLIKQVRAQFYNEKLQNDKIEMYRMLHKNLDFLERHYKVRATPSNIMDYLGIFPHTNYGEWYVERVPLGHHDYFYYIAYFFSIPVELLQSTDLEANENTIKKQYPLIFRQSRN